MPKKFLNNLRVRGAIAGGLGGATGWFLVEGLLTSLNINLSAISIRRMYLYDTVFGALTGVCIGLALGTAEGIIVRSRFMIKRGALIGGIAGIFGGTIGLIFGEMIFQQVKFIPFIGRSLGWGVFGAFLGLAEGISRRSTRGMRNAALGGLIGGIIGGFTFDLIAIFPNLVFNNSVASRAAALIIVGASIGILIFIVQKAFADAWLTISSGQSEGHEFLFDKPHLVVGSSEKCDIVIFNDPTIKPRHAVIIKTNQGYEIESLGEGKIWVNNEEITRGVLKREDLLKLGNTRLTFQNKVTSQAMPESPSYKDSPSQKPIASQDSTVFRKLNTPPFYLLEKNSGKRHPLNMDIITIGRAPDNIISLNDPLVSAHHAEVRYEEGYYILYDLDSTNGTFVNDRRIKKNMIKAGFQIQLGKTRLVMERMNTP